MEQEEIEELARVLVTLHARHSTHTQPVWEVLTREERSLWRLIARTAVNYRPVLGTAKPGSKKQRSGGNGLASNGRRQEKEGRITRFLNFIRSTRGRQTETSPSLSIPVNLPAAPRVVVYTAIVGGYDELKAPRIELPNCELIAFSDVSSRVKGWRVRPLNYLHHDPVRAARFVKLHPHVYFPDCDYSIWLDGNVQVLGNIRKFVQWLSNGSFLGAFPHPTSDCIYEHGERCAAAKQDRVQLIAEHLDRLRLEGFPEKASLWSTSVLVRRHNDPACIDLMTAWWRQLEAGSRRDELILPVLATRRSVAISSLGDLGLAAAKRNVIGLTPHLKERAISEVASPPAVTRAKVDVDSIPIDVGVCVHNGLEETKACLGALATTRRSNQRIIIVDDASDEPTARLLDEFARTHPDVQLIRHEQNQGYTRSANDVLRNSRGKWTVLLNSDTIVAAGALSKLIACGEQFERIGIVGPLSSAATWQTVPRLSGPDGKWMVNRIPDGLSVEDVDRMCEEASTGVVQFVPLINGFCFAIRGAVVDRVGLFDDKNFPVGYGEEDDYCLRAGEAGFLCAIATDAYVYHARSASFTPERRTPLVTAGQEALRRKHTPERIAAAVDLLRQHPELARMRERLAEKFDMYPPLDVVPDRSRHPAQAMAANASVQG